MSFITCKNLDLTEQNLTMDIHAVTQYHRFGADVSEISEKPVAQYKGIFKIPTKKMKLVQTEKGQMISFKAKKEDVLYHTISFATGHIVKNPRLKEIKD